ncbi:polyprenyl diphosphate synthase [Candidatus Saccharibacteria bacterium]|nr:polyprenyl diphosphate synthase [Candidatus Saccharibacteria bacterium]
MEEESLPLHLGFIVDGNRRWAKDRGLPTLEGHRRGLKQVEEVAEECFKRGVKFASFFLFSTENWSRSQEEVGYLMKLVILNVDRLAKKMLKNNTRLAILGGRERVSEEVLAAVDKAEEMTAGCTGGTMGVCFNYGGRDEIVQAIRKMAEQSMEISEEGVAKSLYHPEIPDCDMIVRTSGERRISGFMLWRAAYSEFLFLDKMWPDMTKKDVGDILNEYARRNRRFGK